jgi:phosphopantetheinyl transferase (holo-ACP synthase)
MIGNDIVDIAEAAMKSNWQRKGFLNKVFTEKEQLYISNSDDPDLMVWLLWSIKESSYKIYSRQERKYFLSPLKIESELIMNSGCYKGKVFIGNLKFFTNSTITKDYVSTTALSENNSESSNIFQKDLKFYNEDFNKQREEIRSSLLKHFSEKINRPTEKMTIRKDDYGAPYIVDRLHKLNVSISISHHGRYGAYAFIV